MSSTPSSLRGLVGISVLEMKLELQNRLTIVLLWLTLWGATQLAFATSVRELVTDDDLPRTAPRYRPRSSRQSSEPVDPLNVFLDNLTHLEGGTVWYYSGCEQPMEVYVSSEDLNVTGHRCSAVGENVSDLLGGIVSCAAEDVLTPDKERLLRQIIIPQHLAFIRQTIAVDRIFSSVFPLRPLASTICGTLTIPNFLIQSGVLADHILLIAAAPMAINSARAWTAICQYYAGLPVVTAMNVIPRYLPTSESDPALDKMIRALRHEFLHSLGVAPDVLLGSSGHQIGRFLATPSPSGERMLTSPQLRKVAQTYFNCTELPGVRLESDVAHFSTSMLPDELLSPEGGEFRLTNFSLALLHDLGYAVNLGVADINRWGSGAGCPLVQSFCRNTVNDAFYCRSPCPSRGLCFPTTDCPHHREALAFCDARESGSDECPTTRPYALQRCPDGAMCFASGSAAVGSTIPPYRNRTAAVTACLPYLCLSNGSLAFWLNVSGTPSATLVVCPDGGGLVNFGTSLNQSWAECPSALQFCQPSQNSSTEGRRLPLTLGSPLFAISELGGPLSELSTRKCHAVPTFASSYFAGSAGTRLRFSAVVEMNETASPKVRFTIRCMGVYGSVIKDYLSNSATSPWIHSAIARDLAYLLQTPEPTLVSVQMLAGSTVGDVLQVEVASEIPAAVQADGSPVFAPFMGQPLPFLTWVVTTLLPTRRQSITDVPPFIAIWLTAVDLSQPPSTPPPPSSSSTDKTSSSRHPLSGTAGGMWTFSLVLFTLLYVTVVNGPL